MSGVAVVTDTTQYLPQEVVELSLIHISEPTRRLVISDGVVWW